MIKIGEKVGENMTSQIGIAWIMGIFILAILMSEVKRVKKFNAAYDEAAFKVMSKKYTMENKVEIGSDGILVIAALYMIITLLQSKLNAHFMLILVVLYLVSYYVKEYMVHYKWSISERGIFASRLIDIISWENIVNYKIFKTAKKDVLRINYKGRGIITRKCDLLMPKQHEKRILRILSEHHISEDLR